MASYTAIRKVKGIDVTTGASKIVQPASMEVEIEDISASDAGRTADTVMQKKTLRRICAVSMSWSNLHTAEASKILQLFSTSEYFTMEFLDPYSGGYSTKTFYVGNRTVPAYSAVLDVWSNISFKVVER